MCNNKNNLSVCVCVCVLEVSTTYPTPNSKRNLRMDLKELLSYKPSKRSLERRGDVTEPGVPSKAPRTKLGSEALSKSSSAASVSLPNPLAMVASSGGPAPQGASLDLNGISDEEKLRLLQSMEDEEENAGVCRPFTQTMF